MSEHVDGGTLWIAVAMVDQDGLAPDWVSMVIKAKTGIDVDFDQARAWLVTNPKGCRCAACRPRKSAPPPPRQADLFG